MSSTSIEWTDRVWNPVTGCTKVSAGCKHCYAETIADRFWKTQYPPIEYLETRTGDGFPKQFTATRPRAFTDVQTHEDRLLEPLTWRKPARAFVNSMSDLFHEDVPFEFIDRVFTVMAVAHRHTFQVLTKRPDRMKAYVESFHRPDAVKRAWDVCTWAVGFGCDDAGLGRIEQIGRRPGAPNVWLGVSVENQETADERIPLLLATPAAVRFISAEPLLDAIDIAEFLTAGDSANPIRALNTHGQTGSEANSADTLGPANMEAVAKNVGAIRQEAERPAVRKLDWVIVGGESGQGSRPCNFDWIRSVVSQCAARSVPVFVKQVGADARGLCNWPHHDEHPPKMLDRDGVLTSISGLPGDLCHAAGDAWWPCRWKTRDRKGGDPSEWPHDLRVREFPRLEVPV